MPLHEDSATLDVWSSRTWPWKWHRRLWCLYFVRERVSRRCRSITIEGPIKSTDGLKIMSINWKWPQFIYNAFLSIFIFKCSYETFKKHTHTLDFNKEKRGKKWEQNENKRLINFTLTQVQHAMFGRASQCDSVACCCPAAHSRFHWRYRIHGNVLRCMINVCHWSALVAAQINGPNQLRVKICLFNDNNELVFFGKKIKKQKKKYSESL